MGAKIKKKMALWDREACGNAADFLRLGDAELLTLRNTPFDGRKCIWVPSKDEEVSYAPATIIGEGSKPGTKKISYDGKEKDFKEELIEYQNPPKYYINEDMANLTYLSE